MSLLSRTFCIMPFIHQNIKHEGKVGACWRYPDKLGDYRNESLATIWNNERTRELRRALLHDERPEGCRSCWDFEDSGVKSTRQTCNETYQTKYNIDYNNILSEMEENYHLPFRPRTIEIRFDNTCNLRCRHCSPTYSSQWETLAFKQEQVKDFFRLHGAGRLEKKHINLPDDRFNDFLKSLPFLKEVLIAGGEPLQQKRHWEMIDAMKPYAKDITLSYNSNLVSLGIGKYNVLDVWPSFKKIILRVSIDGDDKIYSYFRTNGEIDKVYKNIQQLHSLQNIEMSLTTTVSIYNISRLVDIVKYTNKAGGLFHTSIVQYPKPINPKVLPKAIKNKITDEWKRFILDLDDDSLWNHSKWNDSRIKEMQKLRIVKFGNYAVDYMNSEDYSDQINQTIGYIKFMDEQSDTDFKLVYPEFQELF